MTKKCTKTEKGLNIFEIVVKYQFTSNCWKIWCRLNITAPCHTEETPAPSMVARRRKP